MVILTSNIISIFSVSHMKIMGLIVLSNPRVFFCLAKVCFALCLLLFLIARSLMLMLCLLTTTVILSCKLAILAAFRFIIFVKSR